MYLIWRGGRGRRGADGVAAWICPRATNSDRGATLVYPTMADLDLDPRAMKVAELKAELKKRGESTSGKKADLIERLELAIEAALMGDDLDVSIW